MATKKGNQGKKTPKKKTAKFARYPKPAEEGTKALGRPPKEYTPEQITQIDILALEGHKTGTIAVALGLNEETLKEHFSERMKQKRVEGKIALKRVQIEKALAGDTGMLVWLGKNMLEQTDKRDTTLSGNVTVNVIDYAKNSDSDGDNSTS